MTVGRFAPSPTGDLHVGNLRTALLAWLFARSSRSSFLVRMEDLDRVTASQVHEQSQLGDLAALGLDHDGPVGRQSERATHYDDAVDRLTAAGLTYPCYCTRREVREASSAPHGPQPEGAYPGTCRSLPPSTRARREAEGRRPALRLRADGEVVGFVDRLRGPTEAVVDDLVLRRADGVAAYNLAVVVDDAAQGIGEVVRGDDLLLSTPRQLHLARLLRLPEPSHAHVPMVLGPDGRRLAKRHGAVTLTDLAAAGWAPSQALGWMAASLDLARPGESVTVDVLLDRFDPTVLPRRPSTFGGVGSPP